MKLKGVRGGRHKNKPQKQVFNVMEYKQRPHVTTCDELTDDMFPKIKDIGINFVKTICEAEVLRKGHMTGISGRRDIEYGVVIANFDNQDMIAPIVFKRNEDALEFSKFIYKVYLYYSHRAMEGNMELLDPSGKQCLELKNVVEGLALMIKKDKESVTVDYRWGLDK